MRHCLERAILVVCAAAVLSLPGAAADLTWLAVDRVPPGPGGAAASSAVLATGLDQAGGVVTATGDLVSLLGVSAQGTLLVQGSFVGDPAPSAFALEDIDADGRWELVSARGDEGALTVDRWVQGQRFAVGTPRYAWMPVKALLVAATRSGKVIVAAGQPGGLATYLVGGRGLEPAGVVEPRQRFELYGAGDLDGDGQDELVAGVGQSGVVVFRWTPGAGWTRWWQNFPWGGTLGAAVGDLDRDGSPELAIASAERLLYVFGRGPGGTSGLVLKWQGEGLVPQGTTGLTYFTALGAVPERAEASPGGLALYGTTGVGLLQFTAKWEPMAAQTRLDGVRQVLAVRPPADEGGVWPRLLVQRSDGTLEAIAAVRTDRVKLVWTLPGGAEIPAAGVALRGGRPYLAVRELAAQLGLTLHWNEERKAAEGVTADGRSVLLLPERAPLVDGQEVAEAGPVIVDGGRTLLEARSVERVFPPQGLEAMRLVVIVAGRRFPASFLW
jgi:hypothetical protein